MLLRTSAMSKENEDKELKTVSGTDEVHSHPDRKYEFSDLDTGWAWMVLFASFGTFFLIGNSMYAVGIIHSSLLDTYNETVTLTSWAGALHTALISLGGPLSTAVIHKLSCRTAITSSGMFFVLGYLATAFAETIEVAIFTCGILAGTGGALGYTAAMVVVGFNFRKRRKIALGIAVSGIGAGLFVLAPVMQYAREYYGPVGFFIILAAMTANIIIFGQLCFPSKLELHTQMQRKYDATQSNEDQNYFATLKPYLDIFTKRAMLCLFMSMFLYCAGTHLIFLHLPTFIVTKGFTEVQASFFVSLTGIMSMFGRLLTGVIANLNRIDDTILFSGPMCIVGIASFIYPFTAEYLAGHVIYTIVLGLFFGSCYVTITAVSLHFVGISYVAAAIGLQLCFGGIGAVVGPVCGSIVVDAGGTYDLSFFVAATCIVLAAMLSGVTMCCRERNRVGVLDRNEIEIEIPEKHQSEIESLHAEDKSCVLKSVQNSGQRKRNVE